MVNSGPDSNESQFFITFGKVEMLDGAHVVFGYIVEGLDVLRAIERCGTPFGKPTKDVIISHCGVLDEK
jgi:cyclophilin family peptidyl-prolyl cis-trans isomerase